MVHIKRLFFRDLRRRRHKLCCYILPCGILMILLLSFDTSQDPTNIYAHQQNILKGYQEDKKVEPMQNHDINITPKLASSQAKIHLKNVEQIHNHDFTPKLASSPKEVDLKEYKAALATHAENNVIILALVDTGFMDMTLNFYETSIQTFQIKNYLFIALDSEACNYLNARDISCYVYMTLSNANISLSFNTKGFNLKTNIRTYMILDALKLGFTVLHTDVDIIFFKNPLVDINYNSSWDLEILWDFEEFNAGFLYVKPTQRSIDVYKFMFNIAEKTELDDQKALNKAIRHVRGNGTLGVNRLLVEKYMCGKEYFEIGKRHFAGDNPCTNCIVVHNNWIISKEAKRYRFQEDHLWMYDDDHYYSDPTRKYLMYNNNKIKISNTIDYELLALQSALFIGYVLNRTVILPRFHCEKHSECTLNSHISIANFDAKFHNRYRESTFLTHPKVPQSITSKISNPYWIHTSKAKDLNGKKPEGNVTILTPVDQEKGPTFSEIKYWFKDINHQVLQFYSLYGISTNLLDNPGLKFKAMLLGAFKKSDYRQQYIHNT